MITGFVNRYNEKHFWKMYLACQNQEVKGILRCIYIFLLKRITSLHCCDFMITLNGKRNFGAYFEGKPYLPHGLNGIVVSDQATLGTGVTILQQVTIGVKEIGGGTPKIGNHVFIGAGAKILGKIKVGDDAIIGANAVVLCDVPKGCMAVGVPARIVKKEKRKYDT